MKVRHFLILAITAVALTACGPMSTGTVKDLNVRNWVGHSAAHLIQSWGTSHHDYPTADGGRVEMHGSGLMAVCILRPARPRSSVSCGGRTEPRAVGVVKGFGSDG